MKELPIAAICFLVGVILSFQTVDAIVVTTEKTADTAGSLTMGQMAQKVIQSKVFKCAAAGSGMLITAFGVFAEASSVDEDNFFKKYGYYMSDYGSLNKNPSTNAGESWNIWGAGWDNYPTWINIGKFVDKSKFGTLAGLSGGAAALAWCT